MAGWIRCSGVMALLVTLAIVAAEQETSVHIKVFKSSAQANEASSSATTSSKDCEVNGVTLRHRSMKYYGEDSYVACSNGQAGCYLIERVHDKATQVACPKDNFQQRIDEETAYREHEEKNKQQVASGQDEEDGRRRLSLVVVSTQRIWDDGVVCYQLNEDYPFNSTQKEYIYEAMGKYEESTNVRFVTTATCEKESLSYCDSCANWVDFKHPSSGRDCNSSIGITDEGAQTMNLADRCFEVDDDLKTVYGSAMHEIGHSLGMYHEHQHPKRTIGVFWDDIDQSIWSEMTIRDLSVGGPYDLDSVMHYPMTYGFCQPNYCSDSVTEDCVKEGTTFCNLNDDDNCTDITKAVCNTTATEAIGQRKYLSSGDLGAINELYQLAAWTVKESKIGK
ncbi:Astacin, peptidase M12A family, neutral zinc metallopeptidase, Zn-binding site [Phytophthora sojae]|uniref:Metalloendopeptidase n=1 Tax=Phytophthora sojae (strain P6497) TaxID=1094619 RepID=G4Z8H3_PHYSP|nr:Astacin, peptidase M12A family, neutral zinc metallopeptidase, Zn-binding site [Phytophthora sojae]EGZ21893.1 Astacin, peptidase M12A family, neutral zinc metallopeptidase, Zn-binding site [Phytophthora sojae]|eukprot:XP_009524610.1 Astacin, peptidase M12A family, neutral zinc metallopeptidase, Zn-binding site [Phytophthora sojae]